jgi:serine/threonine protein kinase
MGQFRGFIQRRGCRPTGAALSADSLTGCDFVTAHVATLACREGSCALGSYQDRGRWRLAWADAISCNMTLIEKRTIAGRYRLERPLARGGMGSVWVARHLTLDVDVAVKFMAPELASSSEAQKRFEREAKASASLRIANAVHVYDYGIEEGTPYLAMELLEGEDLAARLGRQGRLDKAAMSSLVSQVSKALRRAHEIGLVHRDLKPGNLFLARQGAEEVVKILDFGIAKMTGLGVTGPATKTGTLLGSPLYMSPEQIRRSKEVDHRSDLWSLGVIVFECLTGRLPFQGEDLGELLLMICTEEIPLASRIVPELGPEVDRFFARALARDPADRFQSADELAAALAQAMSSVPAALSATEHAPPPAAREGTLSPHGTTLTEPPVQRSRIRRLPAVLAGALTLVLLTALLVRTVTHSDVPAPAPAGSPFATETVEAALPLPSAPLAETQPTTTAAVSSPGARVAVPPAGATVAVPPASATVAPSRPLGPGRFKPPSPPDSKPQPAKGGSRDKDPTRHI